MRTAHIARKTNETDITLTICLDGRGVSAIQSGVGFLDHMLTLLARHGRLDLELTCRGDTQVDDHHSVEASLWGTPWPRPWGKSGGCAGTPHSTCPWTRR